MRRNKLNAVKLRAYVGTQDCKFDSKAEYKYALWLEYERKIGNIKSWRHHPGRIELSGLMGGTVAMMEPDFSVWGRSGKHAYHEVKGMATAAWRIKRALLEQQFPEESYVVIDAGWPGNAETGEAPRLFDDRRKHRAARKKARKARCGVKKAPKRKGAS